MKKLIIFTLLLISVAVAGESRRLRREIDNGAETMALIDSLQAAVDTIKHGVYHSLVQYNVVDTVFCKPILADGKQAIEILYHFEWQVVENAGRKRE
jgi:hypothetical protein